MTTTTTRDRRDRRADDRARRHRYGRHYETNRANRRGGLMYWIAAEWFKVGPFVFACQIHETGLRGPRQLVAVALDPVRYIREVSGTYDIGAGL